MVGIWDGLGCGGAPGHRDALGYGMLGDAGCSEMQGCSGMLRAKDALGFRMLRDLG